MCPVFVAMTSDAVHPDPAEVEQTRWEPWIEFREGVLDGSRDVSQWCREQVTQLPADPLSAPAAADHDLPPACRVV